jgi:hypothetical protein
MRETFARVLAAALMTGAIATVVGMSALFEMPSEPGRPIAAPPSSLQRSVRLEAQPAPPRRTRATRLQTAHPISSPARPVVVTRSLVVTRPQRVHPPARQLASVRQQPKPAPAPAPPAPAVPQPPAAPAVVAVPPSESDKHDAQHGHEHGSDKDHKEHDKHKD